MAGKVGDADGCWQAAPPLELGMATRALRSLPNLLSGSRIGLAAIFVAADGAAVRLAVIVVAALTDYLDGFLARRVNATSRWGALVDPVADRFFALAAVATLLFDGLLSVPQYFAFIARDLATAVGFLVAKAMPALRPVDFKARWTGKAVTALQFATLASALVYRDALPLLVALLLAASLASIADYTLALWRARAA